MSRLIPKAAILLLALAFHARCSVISNPSKDLVADSTAARAYAEARYKANCPVLGSELKAGPKSCVPCFVALNTMKDERDIANEAQQIGQLPPVAKKRLKALIKDLGKCP